MTSNNDELETDDIYLAAYFLECKCELVRRRKDRQKVFFVFTNTAGSILDLRQAFFTGQAVVKAYDYSRRIMAVKELLYNDPQLFNR